MSKVVAIACFILVFYVVRAGADSWYPPNVTVKANSDSKILIRIIPGESVGDLKGFEGSKKGKYAKAEWYRFKGNQYQKYQSIELTNPVAPVFVEVTDIGGLIALDNWHNVGYGYVLVIYNPSGKIIKKYRLEDIYKQEQIEKMNRSVSSILWECEKDTPRLYGKHFKLVDAFGGLIDVNTDTGAINYQSGFSVCE